MIVMCLWPGNSVVFDRVWSEQNSDEDVFKALWENQEVLGARFYRMDVQIDNSSPYVLGSASDFEQDYNDVYFDGGFWCKVVHLLPSVVKDIIKRNEKIMREVHINITCDDGYVADTLRDFATAYEDNFGDWLEVEHGSGFVEFVEIPDPEPSLADIFDMKKKVVEDEGEKELRRLEKEDEEERAWLKQTEEKLAFLRDRGFKVSTYFGGINLGFPYNYIRIAKSGNLWVEIKGSSARTADGRLDLLAPIIDTGRKWSLEDVIEKIAEW